MPLFLIAALVCGGVLDVFPQVTSAATSVKYNVTIMDTSTTWDLTDPTVNNESPTVFSWSLNKGVPEPPIIVANEGLTFQMLVDKKAKTETLTVGKTKTKASYYPVTIIAKSFKAPAAKFQKPYGEEKIDLEIVTTMVKDAVGKLYISGGDVDVSSVQDEKKLTTKIGDGTTDPAGSLVLPIILNRNYVAVKYGVTMGKEVKITTTLTTGVSSILFKGTKKSKFEGKTLLDIASAGILPNPLVGVPLDLTAGTGTLVCADAYMNMSVMQTGPSDILRGSMWVMKITPATK